MEITREISSLPLKLIRWLGRMTDWNPRSEGILATRHTCPGGYALVTIEAQGYTCIYGMVKVEKNMDLSVQVFYSFSDIKCCSP